MIDGRAIIDPSAELGENVSVGPWSIVGPGVVIGDNSVINSHVVLKGPAKIGKGVKIFQFAKSSLYNSLDRSRLWNVLKGF